MNKRTDIYIHLGTMILGHLLFFTVNGHIQKGGTVVKRKVKYTIFSSFGCTNLGIFSMSFGYDIFIPAETAQQSI